MIQVRSVARRVLTSAKRDLADRPETLNCGLLVLHNQSPPRNGEDLAVRQWPATMAGPQRTRRHLCAV